MKSYLKFLSRNKLYTAVEFAGLAVSLAFVVLIGSYVVQQYRVAHENPDWKRVFTLGTDTYIGLTYWDKEELEMNIPEVEVATHVSLLWNPVAVVEEESYSCSGLETDPGFFDVFPEYQLREGSLESFRRKDAILLSASFARRIAREGENLIGKVIRCEETNRTVVGIFRDFDGTFFVPCDVITNIATSYAATQQKSFNSIGNYTTWYRIRQDAVRSEVDAKVMELFHKNYGQSWGNLVENWQTYRLDEAFFSAEKSAGMYRVGNRQMLRLLTVVVLLLLLSAVFNYVNLNFALTGKRSKEMATRRLMGAGRRGILWKYIGESVAFTAACFVVALVLAYLFAPMLNALLMAGKESAAGNMSVKLVFMLTPGYLASYLSAIFLLGTLCGLLPAWTASRFEPVDVIKGTLRRRRKMVFSRIFIVIQNTLAVFLIAMALVMEVQMRHMLARPTHAAVDNRYYLAYSASNYDQMKLLKDKVEQLPFVERVGTGRGLPGQINMSMGVTVDDRKVIMPLIICDSTYFDLLGLEIRETFGHPLVHSLWMSESAFNASGVSDTSASFVRRFHMNGARAEYIGGIVTDFPTGSASEKASNPNGGVLVTRPEEMRWAHHLLIGTTGEEKSYDERILQAFREYRMEQFGLYESPWTSGFLRDLQVRQLDSERRTMRLVELFAALAVLIALLGLLAMSSYFAGEHTKQIAIRKVFGGDVSSETWRNVGSYMKMVAVACVIGIPVAVRAAGLYLERFAWRISGYAWIFVLAIVLATAFAFVSVLWQTLRAARTNPAIELKKEG